MVHVNRLRFLDGACSLLRLFRSDLGNLITFVRGSWLLELCLAVSVVARISELARLPSHVHLAHHGLVLVRVRRGQLVSYHLLHVLFLAFGFW